MKSFECGTLVPGCTWHTEAQESAEVVRRAAEHLRTIGTELQMVSTRSAVHIGGQDFFVVHPLGGQNKPLSEIEASIGPAAKDMLDQLTWWGQATKAARDSEALAQAAE